MFIKGFERSTIQWPWHPAVAYAKLDKLESWQQDLYFMQPQLIGHTNWNLSYVVYLSHDGGQKRYTKPVSFIQKILWILCL